MKVRSALLALAATSLLLVAGCGSDSSDGGSTSTTEAATTTVDGGTSGAGATTTAGDGATTTVGDGATDGAPSEAELSEGLQKGLNLPEEQADCVAGKITGAGLSQAGLEALAGVDPESLSNEDQAAVADAVRDALADC